jgi:hypothetical protein
MNNKGIGVRACQRTSTRLQYQSVDRNLVLVARTSTVAPARATCIRLDAAGQLRAAVFFSEATKSESRNSHYFLQAWRQRLLPARTAQGTSAQANTFALRSRRSSP